MLCPRWQDRLLCVMWRSGETNNGNARWAIERYKLWRPNGLLDERE